jgi:poly(glycerol-phosphate) alpha-glucosyltransferase
MTNSMLHRSRALVREAGAEVTILTYEHRDDYAPVRQKLIERGAMIEGMSLRNLWEDLRSWDDVQLKVAEDRFAGPPPEGLKPLGMDGDQSSHLIHKAWYPTGKLRQIDYYREDGTLLACNQFGEPGTFRRRLTLCDTSGTPLGTWRGPWSLYYLWLDSLPRDPMAYLICDSKTTATHLTSYRRPDVVTIHVIRGSHLLTGSGRPHGTLKQSRKVVMENLASWDAVVFLTEEQRSDVEALLGPQSNLHVIPNNRPVPAELPNLDRETRRGVMLASLSSRKQIDKAIRAVARVGRVRGRKVVVDVWGRGNQAESLRKLIAKEKAPVNLRGHSTTAIDEFETASFSLLTSKSEAFANVLIESMGRGCIPISFDTPYGPADIITDGVDGFLVPQNDIRAMARKIRQVASAKSETLAPMRLAAHERALQFTDFTGRWADLMQSLYAARQQQSE